MREFLLHVLAAAVIVALGVVLLSGCSAVDRIWYGCNADGWRGWEYAQKCADLQRHAEVRRGLE
jgi:hypothetical protein